jgi:hypothetical protein
MKLIPAIQFLAITTTLAFPVKRAEPLEIQNLSASHYSNITLGTLQFTLHDPNTNATDDCHVSW